MGQVENVAQCVTMDLKSAGNYLYLVGETKLELGGSHFASVCELSGGVVPSVDANLAKRTFAALHRAINSGYVQSCHDLSEGGLAVAAAEMAFAGEVGVVIDLGPVPVVDDSVDVVTRLFAESNSRFLCEVKPSAAASFEQALRDIPHARIGDTNSTNRLRVHDGPSSEVRIDADLAELKAAWQAPLDW